MNDIIWLNCKIADNGLGLCEVGEMTSQNIAIIPDLTDTKPTQPKPKTPILQNPCCGQFLTVWVL